MSQVNVDKAIQLAEEKGRAFFKDDKPYDWVLAQEVKKLRVAIIQTIEENLHLADGEVCTLIHLKRAIREVS